MLKETFKVSKGDEEIELAVTIPNAQQSLDAQLYYRKVFAKALKDKVLLRGELEKELIERGIWGPSKEIDRQNLLQAISERIARLGKGGIKLSEGRQLALEIRDYREKLRDLIAEKNILDSNTAEGHADNAKFDYLVSQCTVYNSTGAKYFHDLDDYHARSGDTVAFIAAGKLMQMLYGVESDYELTLPENKFLIKYKYVDDKLRFINKDGKWIDESGRLVDEAGNYIDEEGKLINQFGNKLEDETQPFLDDDGQPIT